MRWANPLRPPVDERGELAMNHPGHDPVPFGRVMEVVDVNGGRIGLEDVYGIDQGDPQLAQARPDAIARAKLEVAVVREDCPALVGFEEETLVCVEGANPVEVR